MKDKPGRNDPCPCGSGKKFKKCCDKKMISGRFMASKISGATAGSTTSKLSSFFQNSISSIPSLGESGRTFTVQKGAPSKKPASETPPEKQAPEKPVSETPPEKKPSKKPKAIKKTAKSEKKSTQVVEPKGPEEEPPEENDEAHS